VIEEMAITRVTVPALVVPGLTSLDALGTDSDGLLQEGSGGGDATVSDASGLVVTKTSGKLWLSNYLPDTTAGAGWVERGVVHNYTTTGSGNVSLATIGAGSTTVPKIVIANIVGVSSSTSPGVASVIAVIRKTFLFAWVGGMYAASQAYATHAHRSDRFSTWTYPTMQFDGSDNIEVYVAAGAPCNASWIIDYTIIHLTAPT
jgi:hypothetical protein